MAFKVGDKVKVVPTKKKSWNSDGLMEVTVGKVGTITGQDPVMGFYVGFKDRGVLDVIKEEGLSRTGLWYHDCDIVKQHPFKGN